MILTFKTNRGNITLCIEGATAGKEAIIQHYKKHLHLFYGVTYINDVVIN